MRGTRSDSHALRQLAQTPGPNDPPLRLLIQAQRNAEASTSPERMGEASPASRESDAPASPTSAASPKPSSSPPIPIPRRSVGEIDGDTEDSRHDGIHADIPHSAEDDALDAFFDNDDSDNDDDDDDDSDSDNHDDVGPPCPDAAGKAEATAVSVSAPFPLKRMRRSHSTVDDRVASPRRRRGNRSGSGGGGWARVAPSAGALAYVEWRTRGTPESLRQAQSWLRSCGSVPASPAAPRRKGSAPAESMSNVQPKRKTPPPSTSSPPPPRVRSASGSSTARGSRILKVRKPKRPSHDETLNPDEVPTESVTNLHASLLSLPASLTVRQTLGQGVGLGKDTIAIFVQLSGALLGRLKLFLSTHFGGVKCTTFMGVSDFAGAQGLLPKHKVVFVGTSLGSRAYPLELMFETLSLLETAAGKVEVIPVLTEASSSTLEVLGSLYPILSHPLDVDQFVDVLCEIGSTWHGKSYLVRRRTQEVERSLVSPRAGASSSGDPLRTTGSKSSGASPSTSPAKTRSPMLLRSLSHRFRRTPRTRARTTSQRRQPRAASTGRSSSGGGMRRFSLRRSPVVAAASPTGSSEEAEPFPGISLHMGVPVVISARELEARMGTASASASASASPPTGDASPIEGPMSAPKSRSSPSEATPNLLLDSSSSPSSSGDKIEPFHVEDNDGPISLFDAHKPLSAASLDRLRSAHVCHLTQVCDADLQRIVALLPVADRNNAAATCRTLYRVACSSPAWKRDWRSTQRRLRPTFAHLSELCECATPASDPVSVLRWILALLQKSVVMEHRLQLLLQYSALAHGPAKRSSLSKTLSQSRVKPALLRDVELAARGRAIRAAILAEPVDGMGVAPTPESVAQPLASLSQPLQLPQVKSTLCWLQVGRRLNPHKWKRGTLWLLGDHVSFAGRVITKRERRKHHAVAIDMVHCRIVPYPEGVGKAMQQLCLSINASPSCRQGLPSKYSLFVRLSDEEERMDWLRALTLVVCKLQNGAKQGEGPPSIMTNAAPAAAGSPTRSGASTPSPLASPIVRLHGAATAATSGGATAVVAQSSSRRRLDSVPLSSSPVFGSTTPMLSADRSTSPVLLDRGALAAAATADSSQAMDQVQQRVRRAARASLHYVSLVPDFGGPLDAYDANLAQACQCVMEAFKGVADVARALHLEHDAQLVNQAAAVLVASVEAFMSADEQGSYKRQFLERTRIQDRTATRLAKARLNMEAVLSGKGPLRAHASSSMDSSGGSSPVMPPSRSGKKANGGHGGDDDQGDDDDDQGAVAASAGVAVPGVMLRKKPRTSLSRGHSSSEDSGSHRGEDGSTIFQRLRSQLRRSVSSMSTHHNGAAEDPLVPDRRSRFRRQSSEKFTTSPYMEQKVRAATVRVPRTRGSRPERQSLTLEEFSTMARDGGESSDGAEDPMGYPAAVHGLDAPLPVDGNGMTGSVVVEGGEVNEDGDDNDDDDDDDDDGEGSVDDVAPVVGSVAAAKLTVSKAVELLSKREQAKDNLNAWTWRKLCMALLHGDALMRRHVQVHDMLNHAVTTSLASVFRSQRGSWLCFEPHALQVKALLRRKCLLAYPSSVARPTVTVWLVKPAGTPLAYVALKPIEDVEIEAEDGWPSCLVFDVLHLLARLNGTDTRVTADGSDSVDLDNVGGNEKVPMSLVSDPVRAAGVTASLWGTGIKDMCPNQWVWDALGLLSWLIDATTTVTS